MNLKSRFFALFTNHTNVLHSVWVQAEDKPDARARLNRTYGVQGFLILCECAEGARDESAIRAKWQPVSV